MIRSLSDREIKIHIDPRKQTPLEGNVQSEPPGEHTEENSVGQIEDKQKDTDQKDLKGVMDDQPDPSEPESAKLGESETFSKTETENPEDTVPEKKETGPKIKIENGKVKKAKHSRKSDDSESFMRI